MTRNLYLIGIFFLCIGFIIALIQAYVFISIEYRIYGLDSFIFLFIISGLVLIFSSIVLLKYFHSKSYIFVFNVLLVTIVLEVIHLIVAFISITSGQLQEIVLPTYLIFLLAGMLVAVGLIFTKAAERPYLKIAGLHISLAC